MWDKLKIDIPGVTKSLRSLREMKSSLAPISCPNYINFKDEIREVLKLIRIVCPPEYSLENSGIANSSNIFLRKNNDPRNMNRDEFSELVNTVRDASLKIAKVILDGNKLSNKYANNLLFPDIESLDKSYFNWIHETVIKPCLFPNLETNIGNTQPATIPIYKIEYANF
jgi:hypothetical protein